MSTQTFRIPEANFKDLENKIAKLSKRTQKLMGEPLKLTVLETLDEPSKKYPGRVNRFFIVTIDGPQAKLGGYTFVAALDVVDVDGQKMTIIRSAPDQALPEGLQDRVKDCDHCNQQRARKTLYVLRKDS